MHGSIVAAMRLVQYSRSLGPNRSTSIAGARPECTEASSLCGRMPAPISISVVTPSFNQGAFLGDTIRSVLEGTLAPDEYIVADGGSTDGSVEILERWGPRLTRWWSEADDGQYAALDRAFAQTSGEVMGWINSDDMYMPWTLAVVSDLFGRFPELEWLTTLYPLTIDRTGRVVMSTYTGGFDRAAFRAGANLPFSAGFWRGIQQESTFWRRSLWSVPVATSMPRSGAPATSSSGAGSSKRPTSSGSNRPSPPSARTRRRKRSTSRRRTLPRGVPSSGQPGAGLALIGRPDSVVAPRRSLAGGRSSAFPAPSEQRRRGHGCCARRASAPGRTTAGRCSPITSSESSLRHRRRWWRRSPRSRTFAR